MGGEAPPGEFELLQTVYVRQARPELGLPPGASGAIIEVLERPQRAYHVEFVAEDGRTAADGAFAPGEPSVVPPAPDGG